MDADAVEELWNTLDKTSLDPSMAYPSAMVALVTSTPNLGTRQKSRKSWFETTPGGTKIEIACEKRSKRRLSRQSSDEAETLLLTHFTNPPKIDFGKLRPGQTRTRTLLVKNPHDYEQEVKVEKIPTKKKFFVDENQFVVGPNETHPIIITWSPGDEGGYREMFLFVVDNSYRLQTFAIGTVEAPPKKKKARPGLLGNKVKRPFSVIQTQSLASINHSYSPKKEEKNVEGPKIKPQETTKRYSPRLHAQPLPICGSNNQENKAPSLLRNLKAKAASKKEKVVQLAKDGRDSTKEDKSDDKKTRRSMRRSNTYSNMSCTGIEIPVIIGEKVEGSFCLPQDDTETPTTQFHNTRSVLKVSSQFSSETNVAYKTEVCTVNAITEKYISTLAEISAGQSNIFLETKDSTISDTQSSNTKAKNNDTIAEMQPAKSQSGSGIPTGSKAKSEKKSSVSKINIDVADGDSIENCQITLPVLSAAVVAESQSRRSSILDTSVTSTEYFSTQDQSSPMSEYFSSNSANEGSINTSECIGEKTVCKVTSRCLEEGTVCVNESAKHDLTNSLNQNSFDNSMKQKESVFSEVTMTPVHVEAKDQIYPTPSFLEESLSYKRKRSMKEETLDDSVFLSSSEFAQFHDAPRCKKTFVSPDSFLKDLNSTKERLNKNLASVAEDGEVLSPDSVLNDSVPHSIMVRHLETIKLNLSDRSFENIISSSQSEKSLRAMARKQKRRSRTSSRGKTLLNDRRETFIKKGKLTIYQKDCNKIPFAENLKKSNFKRSLTEQAPISSPRRTTFTVVKCKSVSKKKVHASWSFCEDVTPKQLKIRLNSDEVNDIQSHSTPVLGKVSSSAAPKVINKVSFIFKHQNEVVASSPKISDSQAALEPSFLKESLPLKENIVEIVEEPSFVSEPSFLRNDFEKTTNCEEKKIRRCSSGTLGKGSPSSEDSLEVMLRSTKTLPSGPAQLNKEFSTRLTISVTKSRPDALIVHKNTVSTEFDLSDRKQQNQISSSDSEGDRRNTSDTSGHLSSDCTGEYLVSHSFPSTPQQLPDSLKLDHSRRSTHVVERSKELNLIEDEKRKLFPPLESEVQNRSPKENKEFIIAYQEEKAGQNINVVSLVKSDGSPVQDIDNKKMKLLQTISSIHEEEKSIKLEKAEPEFRMRKINEDKTSLLLIPASRFAEIPRKDSVQKVFSPIKASMKRIHSNSKVESDIAASKKLKSTSDVEIKSASQIITRQRAASLRSVPSSKTMDRQLVKPKPGMVKCVAQSKLILVKKKGKTVLPKHPHPFAAKNMYYDERWMEKQERGFTNLLNFILTPPEEEKSNEVKVKVDAGKLILDTNRGNVKLAPTNEILSFRTYSVCRKMNRLRRSACRLFQSESIVKVIQKLEAEVESQRLIIRKDKMVHADLGVKQRILDMIISYNPLWLRIGLETIFGEVIPLQSNSDVYGLSRFIVTRLIGNPDIAEEYSHPTVPHLYRDGYSKALAQHLLKKFLMLVYFLDQSKQARLIDHNPCLFCKDSEFKSSKDLLITFSRDYLSGEGDITRHLGYLGCTITYTQTHLDEFDFAVVKLATDLRDGIRLTRILEFLTGTHELRTKLRVPAISRLQKVHNMEVVFKTLTQQGVDPGPNVLARDIVDGHREKTLKLLWAIILNYQVDVLLNEEQLTEEVILLEKSLKVQNQLQLLQNLGKKNQFRRESGEPELHTKSPRLNLLLRWCRAVCAFYKMKIENFTVSFSDGRALCYLVHHYHPALLPIEAIKLQTSITYLEEMEEKGQTNLEQSFNDSSSSGIFADVENPEVFEQLLDNEKENFKILYEKVKELGGIPLMLRSADMSNTIPDEKVVVTYLLYLCARLLDIRHESRAARVIQMAWRKYQLHQAQKVFKVKSAAASKIQKAVRKFLSKQREGQQALAALILQRYWRQHVARKTADRLQQAKLIAQQQRAACIIQQALQSAVQKKKFQNLRHSAIRLQAVIRGFLVRRQILKQHSAAKTIQQYYRSRKLAQQVQCDYQALRTATVNLQALVRGHTTRQTVTRIRAAIKIQSAWRRFAAQTGYRRLRGAAIMIQKHFRGYKKRHIYQSLLSAAICIQRWYHSVRVMREQKLSYRKLKAAALILQTYFRSFKERRQYLFLKAATIRIQTAIRKIQAQTKYRIVLKSIRVIQQAYRAHILKKRQRDEFLKMRIACVRIQLCWREYWFTKMERQCKAATVIQSVYRMFVTRRKYVEQRKAANVLQSVCRGYIERKKFKIMKSSAVLIQKCFHGYLQTKEAMERYQKLRNTAIKLQAVWRMHMQRASFRHQKQAAILIQSHFRGLRQRQKFSSQKSAALKIQRYFRGYRKTKSAVERYNTLRNAAIKLQAVWRMHLQRTSFRHQKQAAILIQSHFRGLRQRQKFSSQKSAALKIQRYFRGYQETKSAIERYNTLRNAAMKLQAVWRMHMQRTSFRHQKQAAILIQSHFRGLIQRQKFSSQKSAALKIQRYFRGYRKTKSAVERYNTLRNAAIKLQAVWRMHMQRTSFRHQKQAAILIQSHFRGLSQRQKFSSQKLAALKIQQYFRGYRKTKSAVETFNTLRNATIKLQAVWRMYTERRLFNQKKQAAISIQSYFRRFCQRKQFSLQQSAAFKIQQCYKGYLQTRSAVQRYNSIRNAAIKLQAFWRMVMAQRRYQNQEAASVVIQSAYRSHKQRKEYKKMRASAVIIQKHYREWLTMKKAHAQYKWIKKATITLQAAWRMYCARSTFVVKQRAAVIIQAHWRRLAAHRTYKQMKKAVVTLQNKYRARQKMMDARKEFILKRKAVNLIQAAYRGLVARRFVKTIRAVVLIQAAFRSYQARKFFQKSRKAAIQIQAFLQMCLAKRRYMRMRRAVIGIQRHYMARLEGRRVHKEYLAQKEASLTIQAWYKGCRVRNYIRHCNFAANLIQAQYRRYRVQQNFRKIKVAALKIQSWYRNTKLSESLRKDYLVQRAAAIKIQAIYRCHLLHCSYLIYRNAVIQVQACVRGHLQQMRYRKLKAAVIFCQHKFRSKLLMCQKQEQYLAQKRAAITIQSVFKCYQTRKQYYYTRKCVILAQALVRGFFQRRKYKQMREVVIAMQHKWRSNMIAKRARKEYMKLRKAALTIQSNFRGRQARKFVNRIQSAIKIQSALRMMLARREYKRKVAKIMLLQSFYKAHLTRKEFLGQKHAIIFIQRMWRVTLVARKCRLEYLATLCKIRLIQTTYRTYKERQRYQKMYQSIIHIQSRIRGVMQRQKYLKAKNAVCLIQSHYRAWQAQKIQRVEFQRVKHACLVIQSHFRVLKTRRFLNRVRAAVTIQTVYRMHCERQKYQRIRSAVVVIQSFCRRVQAIKLREQRLDAVRCLQRNIRIFLQVQGIRQEITRRRKAAMMIQACYRAFLCRRQLVRMRAAMVIQAWWRSVVTRHNYLKTRWIIIQIQGHARCHMAKQKLERIRRKCRAAACIQSAYRDYLAKKKIVQERLERQAALEKIAGAARIHLSVIKVQRFWRKYLALKLAKEKIHSVLVIQRWMQSKLVRLHYLKTLSMIRRIQLAVRRWLHKRNKAAQVLQLATRRWLACRRVIKMHQAATKVQCMWRGYQARRRSTSKKIVQARKRCEEARRSATEDKKLYNRTSSALDYLLKCKHLSQILDALMNLDVSTKLSSVCCEKFVEENAVPVIYKLIRSCNRSMPHMEIIKYSISILLNLSKYDRTTTAVLEADEAVSTLLDLLQVYREKGQIFNKTCTLLGILAQNPHCNSVMLSEEKITDKLQSIYALTARKNKISENLRVTRAKLAAAKNCNSSFPVPTPVKHYKVRPDWILKKKKMREIEDPLTAINFVLESFNILPK
ncbi:hypothetical protein CHS0354_033435 [Potamilus streckersoni]|uniref:Calponin-homology (CH) domain-containing protein n=1 Tax=Potamilus streckersoni TaxID=2493646 RepID=A0AAE0VVC5_9BIVA|nr:hypothetical protein CHS0354_033435 [Potamilus streckersoni]